MAVLSAIYDKPWLITEDGLRTILEVASRESLDPELARQIREEREARPAAVALRRAQRLDGARDAAVRDGVAIIPVVGPIVRYSDFFTRVSGLTSVETLASDVQVALDSPQVRALLLTVDSPGGQVAGVNELAEVLYRARAQLPVWAYVDGLAASAGYWLASAAERVVTDETALLGSIGAVLAVRDPSKLQVRDIEFVSSQSPNKRPDPTTAGGRAEFQRIVDQTAEVFIAAVARNRGMEPDAVVAAGGRGGVAMGRRAVEAGLADALGDFEGTLAALSQDVTRRGGMQPLYSVATAPRGFPAFAHATAATDKESPMPTVEELQAQLAEATQRLEAQQEETRKAQTAAAEAEQRAATARQQAEVAERERVAKEFAATQLAAQRIVSAQQAPLVALYTAIADRPAAVEALGAVFAGAPQHKLLGEAVPSSEALTVLPAARPGALAIEQGELAQVDADTRAWAQRQNGTRKK